MDLPNIPLSGNKRVVIAGAGFAGLKIAKKLAGSGYQVILLDKHNFHQFQPLLYQVATAGLEPSSIAFPLRKIFQKANNVHIRMTEVETIIPEKNSLITDLGEMEYNYLILALGAKTNYFGKKDIEEKSIPMKSVSEALYLRNQIIENYEKAVVCADPVQREILMNIAVVGGGPTGTEVAGALAEMKKYVLPKDYPELDFKGMNIYLIEATPCILNGMSDKSSRKAVRYLEKLDVKIMMNSLVTGYDGKEISIMNTGGLKAGTLIWATGITCNTVSGLPASVYTRGNRIRVDSYNRIEGYENIFAIGDLACMPEKEYPNGHPQVAPAAIQQAQNLYKNLLRMEKGKPLKKFAYKNKGTMATIGRNLAVVDLSFISFYGFFAWLFWMFVHLMSIVGVKNRLFVFINWLWNYFTYDQSLRLIIRQKDQAPKA